MTTIADTLNTCFSEASRVASNVKNEVAKKWNGSTSWQKIGVIALAALAILYPLPALAGVATCTAILVSKTVCPEQYGSIEQKIRRFAEENPILTGTLAAVTLFCAPALTAAVALGAYASTAIDTNRLRVNVHAPY